MKIKRQAILALCIFVGNVFSATAQGCDIDTNTLSSIRQSLNSAAAATETSSILDHLRQARSEIELIEANCTNTAPIGSGQTRSNPVPFGGEGYVEFSTGAFSLTVNPTDLEVTDPPSAGKQWLLLRASVYCEENADERCQVVSPHFSVVGRRGMTYTGTFVQGGNADLFGGGQTEISILFEVDTGDGDFVLFIGYPEVYFAIE